MPDVHSKNPILRRNFKKHWNKIHLLLKYTCKRYRVQAYFEHLRITIFATGESSGIQFLWADGDLPISSNSSSKEVRLPSNHLNDPSLTRPSSIFLVLLATAISNFPLTILSHWTEIHHSITCHNPSIQLENPNFTNTTGKVSYI
jgi:hypothetical protein